MCEGREGITIASVDAAPFFVPCSAADRPPLRVLLLEAIAQYRVFEDSLEQPEVVAAERRARALVAREAERP